MTITLPPPEQRVAAKVVELGKVKESLTAENAEVKQTSAVTLYTLNPETQTLNRRLYTVHPEL